MNKGFATNLKKVPISDLLADILIQIRKRAESQLITKGEVSPAIFAFSPQESDEMKVFTYDVARLMNSSQNKEIIRMMMEEAIQSDEISLVLLVTEAWLLKLPIKDVTKEEVLKINPSEHPDKEEVVLVNIMAKTKQLIATAKIYRNPVSLSEFETVSLTGESEGTLVRYEEDTPSIH